MSEWEYYELVPQLLWARLAVPEYLEKALLCLSYLLPGSQYPGRNPFDNVGAAFKSATFAVRSYSWDEEEEQEWNFAWQDLRISWYKYLGRGMSMNKVMTRRDVRDMLIDCLQSLGGDE